MEGRMENYRRPLVLACVLAVAIISVLGLAEAGFIWGQVADAEGGLGQPIRWLFGLMLILSLGLGLTQI